ncbi:MOSC domain-containing protein [Ruegeria halocynthiae]|uniref:MOSC domain-containing protein n=1 Tax=Ruegeria halocynthiae TaxID=985054 RepID=UPI00055A1C2E|nr:MOSC domain-containing protein [Ruegeria halocynthiae]
MAILNPVDVIGRVDKILVNQDRARGLETQSVDRVDVEFTGFQGDSHASLVREACVRTRRQYEPGTPIRNVRQISIVSLEELSIIASKLEMDTLQPEWLGANLVLSGIPALTQLPPSSRLIFSSGASLVVDMENEPCKFPGDVIEKQHPGKGAKFAYHARNLRGLTAWVEREGQLSMKDEVAVHVPRIQPWPKNAE